MENKVQPEVKQEQKPVPETEQKKKKKPDATQKTREVQDTTQKKKELPKVGHPENTVVIGGQLIEIKETLVKYQRNRTAEFYKMLDVYPLVDLFAMGEGTFGDDRDGDKCIMDFLIAATNNEQLIVENYDEMDTGTIEKILEIFRRVNKINEKEEKLKNLEKIRKGAV